MISNPIIQRPQGNSFKDRTGQVYGRLTVISHAGSKVVCQNPVKYKSVWNVRCTCGNTFIIRGNSLGVRTKSCGCLSRETTIAFNKRTKTKTAYDTFSVVWQSYKQGATRRSLAFDLSKTEFYSLTQQNCHYCDIKPKQVRKARVKGKKSSFIFNGVDRIDSNIGYKLNNCVPCCKTCNYMKQSLGYDEFLAHIAQIHKHKNLK